MEFSSNPWRIAALVALVTGYALWGGMAAPQDPPREVMMIWLAALVLFLASATSATLVDHRVGRPERMNIRWFYIVTGIAGMAGALLILHHFRERLAML